MQVFNRVLDRHDVLMTFGVDFVDNRSEGGRLARAGGPGDQNQASRALGEFGDRRRQSELLKTHNLEWNGPKRGGHRAALHEDVGPKTRQVLDPKREVKLVLFLKLVLLRVGEN